MSEGTATGAVAATRRRARRRRARRVGGFSELPYLVPVLAVITVVVLIPAGVAFYHSFTDWRPGGEHRDPRQPFKDAKAKRNLERRKRRFAVKRKRQDARRKP